MRGGPSAATGAARARAERAFVVFRVGAARCALPLEEVVEVLRMVAIAPVPEAPAWVAGAINLRGRIVPVLDLRRRLGTPAPPPELRTPIIVAEADGRRRGLIVDEIVDVGRLPQESSGEPGELGGDESAVSGLSRRGTRPVVILDLMRLCSAPDHVHAPTASGASG